MDESSLFSFSAACATSPGRSGVDSYSFEANDPFRSLELPRLLGGSAELPELSDRCALWEDLGAFRLPKNDFDVSRLCFGESLGEGKY